ncbi:MAG: HNH endonuclease, partial [Candidatus Woesearchaeota archaeon]
RNTPKFHYNLFKKYGDKKCYLCECNTDKIIVGAHIHRVTDIKKDSSIDDDEKGRQVIDGDNGLWLCSNHDKLFEWGVIYFDNDTLTINLEEVTESQKRFIEELTTNSQIETKHFNKNMNNYLLKHRSRFRKSF